MSEETTQPTPNDESDVRDQALAALEAEQSTKVRRRARPAKNTVAEEPPEPQQEEAQDEAPGEEIQPVTQRRRGKMSSKKPHQSSYKGIPTDQIVEAIEMYPELDVKVSRVNARGQRASLSRFRKTPTELCEIDIWLKEVAGGGRFHVEPLKMGEPGRADPIPPFEFEIEGAPKAFKGSDIDNQASGGAAMQSPFGAPGLFGFTGGAALAQPASQPYVDPKHIPAHVRGMPQQHQMAWAQQQGLMRPHHPQQAPSNAFASDQIAAQELERARQEMAEERKRFEQERREERARWEQEKNEAKKREEEMHQRMQALEQQRLEDQRRASEERHALELERIRADQQRDREQFQQMLQQHQDKKPEPSLFSSPEVVTALGGLVTTFLSNNSEKQFRSLELQQKQQQALMTSFASKNDQKPLMDTIKTVAPVLVPLLSSIWDSKSPKAQADLVATMAENQLTSISMMAELINAFGAGQQEPPFWLPMAQETLKGVVSAAEAMASKNKPQQLPQQQAQQPAVPAQNTPTAQQAQQAQQTADQYSAEQITEFIFADPRYPNWGRSDEWKQALILLHRRSPEAATYIATLLRTLDEEGRTPPEVEPVWENATQVLQQIIAPLPIWQMDNAYAVGVINGIIDILTEEGDQGQPHVAETPPEASPAPQPSPEPSISAPIDTTGEPQPFPVEGKAG